MSGEIVFSCRCRHSLSTLREKLAKDGAPCSCALLVVVGPHSADLAGGVELHDLGGLAVANVVAVVADDNRLDAPEHIDEVEAEIAGRP